MRSAYTSVRRERDPTTAIYSGLVCIIKNSNEREEEEEEEVAGRRTKT